MGRDVIDRPRDAPDPGRDVQNLRDAPLRARKRSRVAAGEMDRRREGRGFNISATPVYTAVQTRLRKHRRQARPRGRSAETEAEPGPLLTQLGNELVSRRAASLPLG